MEKASKQASKVSKAKKRSAILHSGLLLFLSSALLGAGAGAGAAKKRWEEGGLTV
jgi:hypothetical protein